MAFPASTKVWDEPMDPYDVVDYKVDLTPLLAEGEAVSAYTITPLTESQLYGLTVGTSTYAPTLVNNQLTMWLSIGSTYQSNVVFTAGLTLPIEISVTTNSTPPRKRQRTVAVKVIQR